MYFIIYSIVLFSCFWSDVFSEKNSFAYNFFILFSFLSVFFLLRFVILKISVGQAPFITPNTTSQPDEPAPNWLGSAFGLAGDILGGAGLGAALGGIVDKIQDSRDKQDYNHKMGVFRQEESRYASEIENYGSWEEKARLFYGRAFWSFVFSTGVTVVVAVLLFNR